MRQTGLTMLLGAAAALAGCDGNSVPATAIVVTIDRMCTFIAEDPTHTKSEEECGATPEFRALADKGVPKRKIEGHETMHVTYVSPVDGSTLVGDLHLTGRDNQFYTVNAGDQIAIRIKKDDPTRIRRA
ncbi:MAG: hypothetical protein ABIR77_02775 [Sphingomicrobium sp.]